MLAAGSGCAGSTQAAGQDAYVAVDAPAVDGLAIRKLATSTSSRGVASTVDFEQIESVVQRFLDERAAVITRKAQPQDLALLTGPQALAMVIDERAANDELIAEGHNSAVERLLTWTNITALERVDGRIVVTDCTERQEFNAVGQFNLWFVEHGYTLDPTPQGWIVAEFDEIHNGFLEPDRRFGCAPQSFTERAESAASVMWSELVALSRDPNGSIDMSDAFAEPLADLLTDRIRAAYDENLALVSDEVVTFRAIGVDTAADLVKLDARVGTTVVVEACRRFPNGLEIRDLDTDEVVESMAPGGEQAQLLYVRIAGGPEQSRGPDQVYGLETAVGGCGSVQR